MKKRISQMLILIISILFLFTKVYATTEETVISEETILENTQEQTPEEPPKVEEKPTETKKNQTMYVQERCNIRASYSVESNRVGGLDVGTEVMVIAEYSNGWYKIKYGDGEAYIKAGILRSTPPQMEEPEEVPTEEPSMPEQPIVAGSDEEIDSDYADLINEVGVLPEVGYNLADGLLLGAVFLAIFMVIFVIRKEKVSGL